MELGLGPKLESPPLRPVTDKAQSQTTFSGSGQKTARPFALAQRDGVPVGEAPPLSVAETGKSTNSSMVSRTRGIPYDRKVPGRAQRLHNAQVMSLAKTVSEQAGQLDGLREAQADSRESLSTVNVRFGLSEDFRPTVPDGLVGNAEAYIEQNLEPFLPGRADDYFKAVLDTPYGTKVLRPKLVAQAATKLGSSNPRDTSRLLRSLARQMPQPSALKTSASGPTEGDTVVTRPATGPTEVAKTFPRPGNHTRDTFGYLAQTLAPGVSPDTRGDALKEALGSALAHFSSAIGGGKGIDEVLGLLGDIPGSTISGSLDAALGTYEMLKDMTEGKPLDSSLAYDTADALGSALGMWPRGVGAGLMTTLDGALQGDDLWDSAKAGLRTALDANPGFASDMLDVAAAFDSGKFTPGALLEGLRNAKPTGKVRDLDFDAPTPMDLPLPVALDDPPMAEPGDGMGLPAVDEHSFAPAAFEGVDFEDAFGAYSENPWAEVAEASSVGGFMGGIACPVVYVLDDGPVAGMLHIVPTGNTVARGGGLSHVRLDSGGSVGVDGRLLVMPSQAALHGLDGYSIYASGANDMPIDGTSWHGALLSGAQRRPGRPATVITGSDISAPSHLDPKHDLARSYGSDFVVIQPMAPSASALAADRTRRDYVRTHRGQVAYAASGNTTFLVEESASKPTWLGGVVQADGLAVGIDSASEATVDHESDITQYTSHREVFLGKDKGSVLEHASWGNIMGVSMGAAVWDMAVHGGNPVSLMVVPELPGVAPALTALGDALVTMGSSTNPADTSMLARMTAFSLAASDTRDLLRFATSLDTGMSTEQCVLNALNHCMSMTPSRPVPRSRGNMAPIHVNGFGRDGTTGQAVFNPYPRVRGLDNVAGGVPSMRSQGGVAVFTMTDWIGLLRSGISLDPTDPSTSVPALMQANEAAVVFINTTASGSELDFNPLHFGGVFNDPDNLAAFVMCHLGGRASPVVRGQVVVNRGGGDVGAVYEQSIANAAFVYPMPLTDSFRWVFLITSDPATYIASAADVISPLRAGPTGVAAPTYWGIGGVVDGARVVNPVESFPYARLADNGAGGLYVRNIVLPGTITESYRESDGGVIFDRAMRMLNMVYGTSEDAYSAVVTSLAMCHHCDLQVPFTAGTLAAKDDIVMMGGFTFADVRVPMAMYTPVIHANWAANRSLPMDSHGLRTTVFGDYGTDWLRYQADFGPYRCDGVPVVNGMPSTPLTSAAISMRQCTSGGTLSMALGMATVEGSPQQIFWTDLLHDTHQLALQIAAGANAFSLGLMVTEADIAYATNGALAGPLQDKARYKLDSYLEHVGRAVVGWIGKYGTGVGHLHAQTVLSRRPPRSIPQQQEAANRVHAQAHTAGTVEAMAYRGFGFRWHTNYPSALACRAWVDTIGFAITLESTDREARGALTAPMFGRTRAQYAADGVQVRTADDLTIPGFIDIPTASLPYGRMMASEWWNHAITTLIPAWGSGEVIRTVAARDGTQFEDLPMMGFPSYCDVTQYIAPPPVQAVLVRPAVPGIRDPVVRGIPGAFWVPKIAWDGTSLALLRSATSILSDPTPLVFWRKRYQAIPFDNINITRDITTGISTARIQEMVDFMSVPTPSQVTPDQPVVSEDSET